MLSLSVLVLFAALSLTQYFSMRLIQRSRQLEQADEQRRFYLELGQRLVEVQRLDDIERRAATYKSSGALVQLELWVKDAKRLVRELRQRRDERDGPGSRELRLDALPGPTDEVESFRAMEEEIINRVELLTGPRGLLPEIEARLESMTPATAPREVPSGEEQR
jgi:hypothetical protein